MRVWSNGLPDERFVEAVEGCTLSNESFHHADHIRLVWIYLSRLGEPKAAAQMAKTLKNYSAHNGKPERYHHTITLAWVRLVANARESSPADEAFSEFIAKHSYLADQQTLGRHYSQSCLDSAEARAKWVEPDIRPLPR